MTNTELQRRLLLEFERVTERLKLIQKDIDYLKSKVPADETVSNNNDELTELLESLF